MIEYSEDVPHTQRPFGWDEQKEASLEDEEAQQHHEGEAEEVKDSWAHRATSRSISICHKGTACPANPARSRMPSLLHSLIT